MAEPSDVPNLVPPLSLVSPTNKSGLIVVLTALAMCFVLVAFGIRLYVRMAVSGFRLDDCVLTVASVQSVTLIGKVETDKNRYSHVSSPRLCFHKYTKDSADRQNYLNRLKRRRCKKWGHRTRTESADVCF